MMQFAQPTTINNHGSTVGKPLPPPGTEKPPSISITSVENTEYYTLPEPSSDYNSDQSGDLSYDSSPPSKPSYDFSLTSSSNGRRNNFSYHSVPPRRRAIVLCEYWRKSISEISLSKNNVVSVIEGSPSSEWWRVETDSGHQGF